MPKLRVVEDGDPPWRDLPGGGGGPTDTGMETRVTRLEALVEQQAQTNARIEGKFDRLEGKLDRLAEQVTAVSLKVSKLPTNADLWQNTVTIGSVAGVVVTIVLAALAVAN